MRRKGFTLVELLVVIAIIALLLSILMPSLNRARAQGRQVVCLSKSRQMGVALMMYGEDYKGRSVPSVVPTNLQKFGNLWYSHLTPYLDTGKSPVQVMSLTYEDQAKYNSIWNKMICPAETRKSLRAAIMSNTPNFQGIKIVTYAINTAYSVVPNGPSPQAAIRYEKGRGIWSGNTGESRLLADMRSSTVAFAETRDIDYVHGLLYSFYGMSTANTAGTGILDRDWYMPVRHPAGYCGTFVDGHGQTVAAKIIQKDSENIIWKALK